MPIQNSQFSNFLAAVSEYEKTEPELLDKGMIVERVLYAIIAQTGHRKFKYTIGQYQARLEQIADQLEHPSLLMMALAGIGHYDGDPMESIEEISSLFLAGKH